MQATHNPTSEDAAVNDAPGPSNRDVMEHIEEGLTSASKHINASDENPSRGVTNIRESVEQSLARFYLRLQAKLLVPASTLQCIVDELKTVHHLNLSCISAHLEENLRNDAHALEGRSLLEAMQGGDVFGELHATRLATTHTRTLYLKEKFSPVEVMSVLIGRDSNNKQCFAEYIPIKETLLHLLSTPAVVDAVKQPVQAGDGDKLLDVTDGSLHKEHPFFHTASGSRQIEIMLYQDVFEVVNPLGPAKKKHKIVGVYFTLANFLKHFCSTRDHLQLTLLYRESLIKNFGADKVFAKLIADLKDLEHNGITIGNECFKGSIFCIIGDNLGQHSIGGFVESFSRSLHFCRFCDIERAHFVVHPEELGVLRTTESFEAAVTNAESSNTIVQGVKTNSCFNQLQFFHVCQPGLPPCLGHDLFEGIVACDLALYIRNFVRVRKWFSFPKLNYELANFKYMASDSSSKPYEVAEHAKKIAGTAASTWTLLRLLPLCICHYVQDFEDPVWCLLLTLRKIVDIVCSPCLNNSTVAYLQVLIEEYLCDRKELFKSSPLLPKHHYLLHYPCLMIQFGPLINLWTMRFESKHSYFKHCVRKLKNFKSLCKTLVQRHQMLQVHLLSDGFFEPDISTKAVMPIQISAYCAGIQSSIKSCGIDEQNSTVTSQVTYKGTTYTEGSFVAVTNDDHLAFGRITFVVLCGTEVFLVLKCHVGNFQSRLGIYTLEECSQYCCVNVNYLIDFYPLPSYVIRGKRYISQKHFIPI
ncbi:uncharacterized protein LOC135373219 [Ornithodoros turicata]|uniref:uncharacterized protein LOC135373219 n=1 Tax=Ornithodoros turicata TaxID=34597 RepID=UPI0031393497